MEHITIDNTIQTTLIAEVLACGFLAKAFYESPSQEFIETLKADALFEDWVLPIISLDTQIGLALLKSFCAKWDASQFKAVQVDYARLFVGPDALLAPPWESVYLSQERLIFDVQTMQVRAAYARFGLRAEKFDNEPDDHFGLEMNFLAHLAQLGLQALEARDWAVLESIRAARDAFLREHVLKWSPEFLGRVVAHAQTDYFRGLAHLALGCLQLWAEPVS